MPDSIQAAFLSHGRLPDQAAIFLYGKDRYTRFQFGCSRRYGISNTPHFGPFSQWITVGQQIGVGKVRR